jgi:hypothetical protein
MDAIREDFAGFFNIFRCFHREKPFNNCGISEESHSTTHSPLALLVGSIRICQDQPDFDFPLPHKPYLIHILFWYVCTHLGIEPGSMQIVLLTLIPSILATALLHKTVFRKFV